MMNTSVCISCSSPQSLPYCLGRNLYASDKLSFFEVLVYYDACWWLTICLLWFPAIPFDKLHFVLLEGPNALKLGMCRSYDLLLNFVKGNNMHDILKGHSFDVWTHRFCLHHHDSPFEVILSKQMHIYEHTFDKIYNLIASSIYLMSHSFSFYLGTIISSKASCSTGHCKFQRKVV